MLVLNLRRLGRRRLLGIAIGYCAATWLAVSATIIGAGHLID
jgi:hypothetical protein